MIIFGLPRKIQKKESSLYLIHSNGSPRQDDYDGWSRHSKKESISLASLGEIFNAFSEKEDIPHFHELLDKSHIITDTLIKKLKWKNKSNPYWVYHHTDTENGKSMIRIPTLLPAVINTTGIMASSLYNKDGPEPEFLYALFNAGGESKRKMKKTLERMFLANLDEIYIKLPSNTGKEREVSSVAILGTFVGSESSGGRNHLPGLELMDVHLSRSIEGYGYSMKRSM